MRLREQARRVLRDVFEKNQHAEPIEVRRAIRDAYPFAKRKGHAYRVWLSEVRGLCTRAGIAWRRQGAPREQLKLFRV